MPIGIYKHKKGYKHLEETKRKIKLALTGKKLTKSHINNISLGHIDIKYPNRKRIKLTKEHKRNISIGLLGNKRKPHTEETKEKIRRSLTGRKIPHIWTQENKEKMRQKRLNQIFPLKDTSIEIKIQNLLKENGIEFQTHVPLLGQPDIFIKPNILIFCDGCYWHKCKKCGFIDKVINEKDVRITKELQQQGYTVIRIWEHDINNNLSDWSQKISTFVN